MTVLILLLVAGLVLLIAEIFLPGMIAGIAGVLCFLTAIGWAGSEFGAQAALLLMIAEMIGGLILFGLWMKYFPNSPFGRRFSLPESDKQVSSSSHDELVGQTGTAVTPLRPSGTAKIGSKRVDVVTEGSHIPAGGDITVVKVEGSRIVVRSFSPSPVS